MFDNITTHEETETIIKRTMTIVLTEAEATAALVDPAKLLKRIRAARATWADTGKGAWSRTGHGGGRSRTASAAPRTLAKKAGRGIPVRTRPAPTPCPYCAKLLDPRGAGKHLAKHQRQGDPLAE